MPLSPPPNHHHPHAHSPASPSPPPSHPPTLPPPTHALALTGNQGYDLSTQPTYPASYSATYNFVLTVGASDQNSVMPSFSNYDTVAVR